MRGLGESFTKESKCWIGRGEEEEREGEARWWLCSGFATGCASGILICATISRNGDGRSYSAGGQYYWASRLVPS